MDHRTAVHVLHAIMKTQHPLERVRRAGSRRLIGLRITGFKSEAIAKRKALTVLLGIEHPLELPAKPIDRRVANLIASQLRLFPQESTV